MGEKEGEERGGLALGKGHRGSTAERSKRICGLSMYLSIYLPFSIRCL